MYRILFLLAIARGAWSGTVQGVVLEQSTGRPLSRTVIRLEPVQKSGSTPVEALAMRAGGSGQFVFPSVAPGVYLLHAMRPGYFPAAFGQRLPIGHGTPFEVTTDSHLFAELRLRRKGAITGRVLDENGVATAGIPVVAYRARLPLRSSGTVTSDDRGVFRIPGLDPGRYWVRSGAYTFDDGSGWLPTFGPQSREPHEARLHPVTVDADTTDADISPDPGGLFHLGGTITCDELGPVIVTLSSETGRRRTQTACTHSYRFEGLAPGNYEVLAQLQDLPPAGFLELFVDRETDSANVAVMQLPTVEIEIRNAGSDSPATFPVTLLGRRQDFAETDPAKEIMGQRANLAPGHWEFRARVPAGQYVESIVKLRNPPRRSARPEPAPDWFEVFIEPRNTSRIRITVSDKAGQIGGTVKTEGKLIPGAPVFLWPVAESARRSLAGPLQVVTDADGRFHFESLPAGDYRILGSFDVNEVDAEFMEMSRAPVVHADASQTATIDLALWIAP